MPFALYLDRQSFIHQRHPIVKALALLLFFVTAFVVDHPLFILPVSAGIGGLTWLSGSWPTVYRLRVLFIFIFVFTVCIWSIFYGSGSRIAVVPFLPVTEEGFLFGLGMAMKLSTFLATGALFLATTRVEEFAFALTSLGVPYRLGFTITLAFRLVPLFLDAVLTVIQAQRCRGLDIHSGPVWQRLRSYVLVIIPVFMGALRRADQMAIALEVRGFNSARPRTSYQRTPWQVSDTLALLAVCGVTVIYLGLWWAGYGQIGLASS
ncbi:MAG: energy-coupling factor transporter transmembrane component T family protein [Candidatus Binatia bacterium]